MELIDRERAIKTVRAVAEDWSINIRESSYWAGFSLGIDIAIQTIANEVPRIEATGKWLYYLDNGRMRCKCSNCLTSYGCLDTPFCPNCGFKMEG